MKSCLDGAGIVGVSMVSSRIQLSEPVGTNGWRATLPDPRFMDMSCRSMDGPTSYIPKVPPL